MASELQTKIVQITRPNHDAQPQVVNVKITISKDDESDTVELPTKLLPKTEEEILQSEFSALTIDKIIGTNTSGNDIKTNLVLPTTGTQSDATIAWSTSNASYITVAGIVTRPPYSYGNAPITLTAKIKVGDKEIEKSFQLIIVKMEQTDEEILVEYLSNLDVTTLLGANVSQNQITENLVLPLAGTNGILNTWESSNPLVITDFGSVTRPDIATGNVNVNMTVTARRNAVNKTRTIAFTVLADV